MRVLCRREGLAQCGCAAAIRAFLPPHSLLQLPSAPKAGGRTRSPPHLRQAVGGGEEGPPHNPPQLPPGTASRLACFAGRRCRLGPAPSSCANSPQPKPPRHWPPNRSHNPRQAGATIPVMPVPLPPPSQSQYWKAKTNTIVRKNRYLLCMLFQNGTFFLGNKSLTISY